MTFESKLGLEDVANWLGARFQGLDYSTNGDTTEIVLEMWVQVSPLPAEKQLRRFKFVDVRETMVSTKTAELLRSTVLGGNVTQGWLSDSDVLDVSIYATGGYMRIVARDVEPGDSLTSPGSGVQEPAEI